MFIIFFIQPIIWFNPFYNKIILSEHQIFTRVITRQYPRCLLNIPEEYRFPIQLDFDVFGSSVRMNSIFIIIPDPYHRNSRLFVEFQCDNIISGERGQPNMHVITGIIKPIYQLINRPWIISIFFQNIYIWWFCWYFMNLLGSPYKYNLYRIFLNSKLPKSSKTSIPDKPI